MVKRLFRQRSQHLKKVLNTITLIVFLSMLTVGLTTMSRVQAAPTVTISPTSGPAGTKVQATGSGFTPNGQVVATLNGKVVSRLGTATAKSNGDLDVTVTVPNVAAGTYNLQVEDVTTGSTAEITFTVTSSSSSPSPTATVPEFPSLLAILTVFIAVSLFVAVLVTARKSKMQSSENYY
jgi:hypothetical protein